MTISYGWEKLHQAVHALAGAVEQKERLQNALSFDLLNIKPGTDLPEELQAGFAEFMVQMTAVAADGDEGTIYATVRRMDENGVKMAIEKIIGFYDRICRYMPKD